MTAPNHITGGIVFTGLFCSLFSINIFQNPLYISLTLFGSLFPDIDHTKSLIGKLFYPLAKWLSIKFGHRTITHSIFFLFTIVFISVFIDKIFFENYNISIILFFSIFSHLLFDMLTLQGIPLFYPIYKNPCVLPANPDLRIRTGNLKQEGIILFIFSIMTIFMQDLFQDGFWSTLNQSFGSITHINKEFKNTNNFIVVDYDFYEFGDHKKGKAYLINSTANTLTLFNNSEVFTLNKSNSNQKKIVLNMKKTEEIYKYKTVEFSSKSEMEVNNLTRYNIVKGTLIGSNSYLMNNSKRLENDVSLENTFSPYFQFISNDSLKKKLKKELRLKRLRLKTIQKKNYKKVNELKKLKDKLNIAQTLLSKTSDLYLKNKYENEIIKYKKKIDNYNLETESVGEIKAEIEFTKELINTENPNYFSGKLQILEIPKDKLKTKKDSIIILKNPTYTIHYSLEKNNPIKTIHKLNKEDLTNNKFNRGYFKSDERLKNSITESDYKNSGFSKGHLVPADDRKKNAKNFNNTFLMSNVAPQIQNFNAGIWLRLENKIRKYVEENNTEITIYTGSKFEDKKNYISSKQIHIPTSFYKIIIDKDKYKAFLIPHKESVTKLENFSIKVDSLENRNLKQIIKF